MDRSSDITSFDITGCDITGSDITGSDITGYSRARFPTEERLAIDPIRFLTYRALGRGPRRVQEIVYL